MVDDGAAENRFDGTARHVVQARDIYGDVHLHETAAGLARSPLFMLPAETEHLVARPELHEEVIARLGVAGEASLVAIAGVGGAGGFGKTTLAAQVCRDARVSSRFDEVLWLTVGEHAEGSDLAAKINDLAGHLATTRPSYVDPQQAGHYLSTLLQDRPRLLVLDDVWRAAQLEPFLVGGDRCVRLVTTRLPAILPSGARPVTVHQMTVGQAEELLLDGLPVTAGTDISELLRSTGCWPVLLRLANGAIRRMLRTGASLDMALRWVIDQLKTSGPAALDPKNAGERTAAVAATVDASLRLLGELNDRWLTRFLDLAVFPDDTAIPLTVLTTFWAHRGRLSDDESLRLCLELRDLSLVEAIDFGERREVRLHDVIREYVRHRTAATADLHRDFLAAYRSSSATWWELSETERYLARNLGFHLANAGLEDELTGLVCDPRWLALVLRLFGPPAAESDLARSVDPTAAAIAEVVRQNAHLLSPIEPDAMLPLLLGRLGCDRRLTDLVREQVALLEYDHLLPSKPLPDAPHPAVVRTIRVANTEVHQLATSPTHDWFATTSRNNGQLRLWNADGTLRAIFELGSTEVTAFAFSPDGRWLAAAGSSRSSRAGNRQSVGEEIRLWSVGGEPIASLPLQSSTHGLAWSPDSEWIVTSRLEFVDRLGARLPSQRLPTQVDLHASYVAVSPDASLVALASGVTVWLFDRSGQPTRTFAGHTGKINGMAFEPDGQWIATASQDGTVRINTVDGTCQTVLSADTAAVQALSIAPDGQRVATVDDTGRLRLWNADGVSQVTVDAHPTSKIRGVAYTRDGRRVITGDEQGAARIWDVSVALQQHSTSATLTTVMAVSSDGIWMVGTNEAGAVLVFDRTAGSIVRRIWTPDGDPRIEHVCISGDGRYLIGVGGSPGRNAPTGIVFIWSMDGVQELELPRHNGPVQTAAISPDSTWFATGALDGTLRFWERAGSPRATVEQAGWVFAVAVTPNGHYLVSGHEGGEIRISEPDAIERKRFKSDEYGAVLALAVSADSTTIISGHSRGSVCVWTLAGEPIATFNAHTSVSDLALSPGERWLATVGYEGTLRIWDWRTQKCHAATRVDGYLHKVQWLPDSKTIIASGNAGIFEFSFQSTSQ